MHTVELVQRAINQSLTGLQYTSFSGDFLGINPFPKLPGLMVFEFFCDDFAWGYAANNRFDFTDGSQVNEIRPLYVVECGILPKGTCDIVVDGKMGKHFSGETELIYFGRCSKPMKSAKWGESFVSMFSRQLDDANSLESYPFCDAASFWGAVMSIVGSHDELKSYA